MPACATSVPGVFCAADWVAQGPGDAAGGAKGLSQEKALAAGLEAGNAVRARPPLYQLNCTQAGQAAVSQRCRYYLLRIA